MYEGETQTDKGEWNNVKGEKLTQSLGSVAMATDSAGS
jgi:hypothetical protein